MVHGHLGGMPPILDLEVERQLSQILVAGSRDGMLTAAHDVSDGGVAITLAEMAMRSGIGARLWVPDDIDPFVWFCSRVGVACRCRGSAQRSCASPRCVARGTSQRLASALWTPNSAPMPVTPPERRFCGRRRVHRHHRRPPCGPIPPPSRPFSPDAPRIGTSWRRYEAGNRHVAWVGRLERATTWTARRDPPRQPRLISTCAI